MMIGFKITARLAKDSGRGFERTGETAPAFSNYFLLAGICIAAVKDSKAADHRRFDDRFRELASAITSTDGDWIRAESKAYQLA